MRVGGKKIALLNELEFARADKNSDFDRVHRLEDFRKLAKARMPEAYDKAPHAAAIVALAQHYKARAFTVPDAFPAGLYEQLGKLGLELEISHEIFPERQIKTARQAAAIRDANRITAIGIAAAEKILRAAVIRAGKLHYRGKPLTSEILKTAIEVACLEGGALSMGTIAAGGKQACDPHETGQGVLRANELIIVDVFPRVLKTRYHGDMTRTFLKGRANDAQRRLVDAVLEAQRNTIAALRAGVNGRDVHQRVVDTFAAKDFHTRRLKSHSEGFFHGTGHGLGLEIHEAPRASVVDCELLENTVLTIEPGLYYPEIGACRIEDVVQVTKRGHRLLSDYHYEWILR